MGRKFNILSVLIVSIILWLTVSAIELHGQLPPGIPRGDIVVVTAKELGRIPNPEWGNVWVPGVPSGVTYIFEPFYYYNETESNPEKVLIPCLAAGLPEYSSDYKKLRIRIKEGIYWSDGVEFTAYDVVFTIKLINKTDGFAGTSFWRRWLKDIYAEGKYTFVIELKSPNPRFHLMQFTEIMAAGSLRIMPKHIWERVEDPIRFPFFPPVSTGPYKLKDYDPNGYWFLFERREDWYRSGIGKTFGKPKPKYVLRVYYGPTEKELIAQAKHELDFMEVDVKLLRQALAQNPYAAGYRIGWPIIRIDAGGHGPAYNCAKYPFNITDVRWALTLAINITEVDIVLFEGRAGICTFDAVSNPFIRKIFLDLYLPWLRNFTLPDGYKPFDETIPYRIAEWAKAQGYEIVGDIRDLIGDGWWKYDPKKAAELLEKHGFRRDANGMWRLPDGTPWRINMIASADHPLLSVLIFGVADQWRKFGIDLVVETLPAALMTRRWQLGDFDVAVVCPVAVQTADIWRHYESFHKMYYKPLGEVATGAQNRWVSNEFSELLDRLAAIPPFTPESIRLGFEAITVLIKEMPWTNLFFGSKALIVDNYVWTNWPLYPTNWYWEMLYWNPVWTQVMFVYIRPTGNVPSSELYIEYTKVWFIKDVSSFIGVDGVSYGPYKIGDTATLPKDDAERLVVEGLASYTPPTYLYVTVYAEKDIPAFRGVDGRNYGPYRPGDAMVIPKDDADRLVAEGLATYTPAEITEIAKSLSDILVKISNIETSLSGLTSSIRRELSSSISSLENSITSLKNSVDSLSSQIPSITTTTMAMNAVTIILVIVAIIIVLRKK